MCDFDITSFRERRSRVSKRKDKGKAACTKPGNVAVKSTFQEVLLKRKQLGLDKSESSSSESDSDESVQQKKKHKNQYDHFNDLTWLDSDDSSDETQEKKDTNTEKPTVTSSSPPPLPPSSPLSPPPSSTFVPQAATDSCIVLSDDETSTIKPEPAISSQRSRSIPSTQTPPRPPKTTPAITLPSIEIDELEPELAMAGTTRSATPPDRLSMDPFDENTDLSGPQKVQIKVQFVSLETHDDPRFKAIIDKMAKPVKIIIMDNDPFDKLLTHYCKRKFLRKADVLLVYKDVPVMLRATPASLGMSGTTHNLLYVYLKNDYEKKQAADLEQRTERLRNLGKDIFDEDFLDSFESSSRQTHEEPPEGEEEDRMFIKLRDKDNEDVTMRVKKTTKFRNVAEHYLRIKELGQELIDKVQFSFEGEVLSLDDAVRDTELEDQDMLSVTIKS